LESPVSSATGTFLVGNTLSRLRTSSSLADRLLERTLLCDFISLPIGIAFLIKIEIKYKDLALLPLFLQLNIILRQ
jgi:hypothetical protein